jgi:AraC family transcriptional regulator of adaptative response/methylated-DNA-[protein]-cysteine methyltransferase
MMAVVEAVKDDALWQAVVARDASANGRFVFGVASTGIYCRPSCPARRPARAHVRFFADGVAAQAAGFRACLRCHPDDAAREAVALAHMLAALRAAGGPVPLADLAQGCGYSPAHAQRLFTRGFGLSPAAYGRALRRDASADTLAQQPRVVDAAFAAGYGTMSRFYAEAKARPGLSPAQARRGGAGRIRFAVAPTTLGDLLVAATDKGVCRVAFGETQAELAKRFPHADLVAGDDAFAAVVAQVVAQVEAPGQPHAIVLDIAGTAFQEAVWRALAQIPAGETRSYAQLAAAAGHPTAMRAVGSANGANPVAVLIPCHRVVRADGALGGYRWGEERKAALLAREAGQTNE